jgi:hypothetical protein
MFFEKFEDVIRADDTVAAAVEVGQWDRVIDYVNREVFDKPEEYYTLDKLRKAAAVDRRLTLREILERVFGLIPRFKSRDELLEEEFSKFVADTKPEEAAAMPAIKTFFKAYVTSDRAPSSKALHRLGDQPLFHSRLARRYRRYRTLIPEYVKDYVSLNQFAIGTNDMAKESLIPKHMATETEELRWPNWFSTSFALLRPLDKRSCTHRSNGAGGPFGEAEHRRRQQGFRHLQRNGTQTHQRSAGQLEELRLDYDFRQRGLPIWDQTIPPAELIDAGAPPPTMWPFG